MRCFFRFKCLTYLPTVLLALVLQSSWGATPATVTIDSKTTYQTIEGLGGFGGMRVWWAGDNPSTYFDSNWISLMIDTLGITALRDDIPPCFEDPQPTNDTEVDINAININSKPYGDDKFSTHIPLWNALHDAGVNVFIFSAWTPPNWMKTNNAPDGGSLKDGMYNAYAERTAAFCRLFKKYVGIDPYAVNVSNEPSLGGQAYASSAWSNGQQQQAVVAIAAKFKKYGISTKIFWPDDVIGSNGDNLWADYNTMLNDTSSAHLPYAFATHYGYNGTKPWQIFWDSCAVAHNYKFWGTEEWCGGGPSNNPPARDLSGNDIWPAPLWTGMGISSLLQYGGSMFTFWLLGASTVDNKADEALILNDKADKRDYIVRQYMRFIRPGAVKVKSTWANTKLDIMSFYHPDSSIWTVVIMDTASVAQEISINCNDPAFPTQLQMYETTQNENCADKGKVSLNDIVIPATGVVTLVTRLPGLPMAVRQLQPNSFFTQQIQGNKLVSYYDLRGRSIMSTNTGSFFANKRLEIRGVYLKVTRSQNGAVTEKKLY